MRPDTKNTLLKTAVWILRIAVGAVFLMSGTVKAIDPWGFVFKLEEYLAAFGFDIPRSIVLTGGISLCVYEFVFGMLLATGCCRRIAPLALTALMAVMLPLTAYIAIANPVSDCGCFGDAWVLSNNATFLKNLVITAALIFLIIHNKTGIRPIFRPAIQWVADIIAGLYIIGISLYGYNIQPMIDFRPFAPGNALVATDDESDNIAFVYEKNGEQQTFSPDELPGDDWTFIKRLDNTSHHSESLHILDNDGIDIADEIITPEGRLLLIVVPEPHRADISYTYFINELNDKAHAAGIDVVALLATGAKGIERWKDISMAAYPCYTAEDTQLKELARGLMSLVLVDNNTVVGKATLSSLVTDTTENNPMLTVDRLATQKSATLFWQATATVAVALLLLFIFQGIILQGRNMVRKKIRNAKARRQPPAGQKT